MNLASVTLVLSALSAGLTYLSIWLFEPTTGLAPVYFPAGIVLACSIVFGWRVAGLAITSSLATSYFIQYQTFAQPTELYPLLAEGLALLCVAIWGDLTKRFKWFTRFRENRNVLWPMMVSATLLAALATGGLLYGHTYRIGLSQLFDTLDVIALSLSLVSPCLLITPQLIQYFQNGFGRKTHEMWTFTTLVVITAFASWMYFNELAEQHSRINDRLDNHKAELTRALNDRVTSHQAVLKSLARLIEFNPSISRQEFAHFVSLTLREEQDIFALSYNPLIMEQQRQDFEATMREVLSNDNFSIKERVDGHVQVSPKNIMYVPVAIIEPLASNQGALGFNIFSEATRRAAILSSLSSHEAAVTAPIQLVQENKPRMAALLLEPVFSTYEDVQIEQKREVKGFSVAVLKVDELFKLNLAAFLEPTIQYRLFDASGNAVQNNFISTLSNAKHEIPAFKRTNQLTIADRVWQLELVPSLDYLIAQKLEPSILFGAGCFLIAALLQSLIVLIIRHTDDIKQQVREQTAIISEKMQLADAAHRELQDRKERQDKMFAIIGHELRTPVSAIKMMLDNHSDNFAGPHSQSIRNTVNHLISVLDDMRLVVNSNTNQLEREVYAKPADVIEAASYANATALENSAISLEVKQSYATQQSYWLREKTLRQIIHNLLRNAMLHSGATAVVVSSYIKVTPNNPPRLLLTISDDGCGIEEKYRAKLFEAFHRGKTDADGTGLGLSICRQLAQDLGGDIRFKSSPQGGAEFELSMPIRAELINTRDQSSPPVIAKPAPNKLHDRSVLLVEDNATIRMMTSAMLENMFSEVLVANNGEEALTLFHSHPVDVVLTDIFMPVMDGYELTRNLRSEGFHGLIIGATAATVGDEHNHLLSAGADAVLHKPLDREMLLDCLADHAHLLQDEQHSR